MVKKMLIDATHAEETRVVVVDGNKVEEFDFESENKRQLAGNIYLAKVTRVEPSLQAAFVDYGGNRHGFLAFSEIHPDYYQIPVADREALLAEEQAYADAQAAFDEASEDKPKEKPKRTRVPRRRKSAKSEAAEAMAEAEADQTAHIEAQEGADQQADPAVDAPAQAVDTPAADQTTDAAGTDAGDDRPPQAERRKKSDPVIQSDLPEGGDDIAGMETIDLSEDAAEETPAADDMDADEALSPIMRARETPVEEPEGDEAPVIEDLQAADDQEDIRPPRKPRPRRYKIQEVINVRQILLVQVVKEERGNKGAALTTYLSLPGRYCVLMPNTARGGGISRKITNVADRKKLKEIAGGLEVPKGAGLIIRTAGAERTKSEIKRDYEYLQRLWEQIRALTLKSIAPAKIYEEGDLIKRSIRDLYNRDIDEVLVEGERGYRNAKDFMKMIMPSHAKNVKHYVDQMPLFARYQVESYLGQMFNPVVQLKSGGYIVIGITEALVAIDVNSGRATKEGSIEETALKTNLEAADEVARQLRLRDLAGLIVIDFIDMDERRNNAAVEKRMKDKLKNDRARIQVGRISGFGLMEMSRQRLRPGMIEATTQACPSCHGTGLIRSDDNLALTILRQVEEEAMRGRGREVLVRCPVGVANFIMNQKRDHVAQIEARYGMSIRVEGDPALVSPDFTLEKLKTATRTVAEAAAPVVSVDSWDADADDAAEEAAVDHQPEQEDGEDKPKKRRRRRRRRKGGSDQADAAEATGAEAEAGGDEADQSGESAAADQDQAAEAEEKPKRTRRRGGRKPKQSDDAPAEAPADADTGVAEASPAVEPAEATDGTEAPEAPAEEAPKPRRRAPRKKAVKAEEAAAPSDTASDAQPAEAAPEEAAPTADTPAAAPAEAPPAEEAPAAPAAEEPAKPKKRGWWSILQG